MPGSPNIGEGFIRTRDLLDQLMTDVNLAYELLEKDKQSQYLRRCVVRAVFSYIEAVIEGVKSELRSAVRTMHHSEKLKLSTKDYETLGSLSFFRNTKSEKFFPLEQNAKRTFRLAAKIWGLKEFKLTTNGKEYQDFLAAKSGRNRLTHPRTFYDIEVNDHDMHCHSVALAWIDSEFRRLLHTKIQALDVKLNK